MWMRLLLCLLVASWAMDAGPASDSDDMAAFDPERAFEDSAHSRAAERVRSVNLDPEQIEVVADADEDRLLEFHVNCGPFLGAPAEHIKPILEQIPLHEPDNFRELTEDKTCTGPFVSKCGLITSGQMADVWKHHGARGLRKFHEIGCLQKLTDFSSLIEPEQLAVLKEFPVRDWESWWAFSPATLLELVMHHKLSDRLQFVDKPARIAEFVRSDAWRLSREAWQLFDGPFIESLCRDTETATQLAALLAFDRRFPHFMEAGHGKGTSKSNTKMVTRWAVRLHHFVLTMARGAAKTSAAGHVIIGLLNELLLAADRLATLKPASSKAKELVRTARSVVLGLPPVLVEAVEALGTRPFAFVAARQLSEQLAGFANYAEIQTKVLALQRARDTQKEALLAPEQLCAAFSHQATRSLKPALRDEFQKEQLMLQMRPGMTPDELGLLLAVIDGDLRGVHINMPLRGSSSEEDEALLDQVPSLVKGWLTTAGLHGLGCAFEHVCSLLNQAWGSPTTIEDLIVELAQENDDFVECALHALRDPSKAAQLILRPELEGDYKFTVLNVFFEEIHGLPLEDIQFFKPSFDLLVDPQRHEIEFDWFVVAYSNEQGQDGGGLRRNWILKMLWALADPKRGFLKTHQRYLVPGLFLHDQVMFGLGRLMGKGLVYDAGLPFAFHPDLVQLMKGPRSEPLLRRYFEAWYAEELQQIRWIGDYADGDLEQVGDLELMPPDCWKLADDTGGRTIGVMISEAVKAGCGVPIGKDLQTGRPLLWTLEQYTELEARHKPGFDPANRTALINGLASKAFPHAFSPKSPDEVRRYAGDARERAWVQFKLGIESFVRGLDFFINVDMFPLLKDTIVAAIFSPTLAIDMPSMIQAFSYHNADNVWMAVRQPADVPAAFRKHVHRLGDQPAMIAGPHAFQLAVSLLEAEELHGLVGQLTGSRVTGLGGLKPGIFTVSFHTTKPRRPLILPEADEDVPCLVEQPPPLATQPRPATPVTSHSSSDAHSEESGSAEQPTGPANVDYPFCASW